MADLPVTVLDFGSDTCKAGFANPEEDPIVVLPTKVKLKNSSGESEYSYPVRCGNIEDWDQMECIVQHLLYDQLGWEFGNEGCVLTSEPLFTAKRSRERLTQMFFEGFNVHGLYVAEAPVLSLHSIGRVSGTVVDIGHQKCDIAPVVEGLCLSAAARRVGSGSETITRHLMSRLSSEAGGGGGVSLAEAEAIKRNCIAVVPVRSEYEMAAKKRGAVEHVLPDGRVMTVPGELQLEAGEILMEPLRVGVDKAGMALEATSAVLACPLETRKTLFESVLVCGGGSGLSGLAPRLLSDFTQFAPTSCRPQLLEPPEYMPKRTLDFSSWIGGAVLAKVIFPQNQFVTKYEYDESGPNIVHRKCG